MENLFTCSKKCCFSKSHIIHQIIDHFVQALWRSKPWARRLLRENLGGSCWNVGKNHGHSIVQFHRTCDFQWIMIICDLLLEFWEIKETYEFSQSIVWIVRRAKMRRNCWCMTCSIPREIAKIRAAHLHTSAWMNDNHLQLSVFEGKM